MKKSLVIISFAFIFLLSMSIVSASWLGDLFDGKSKTSGSVITQDNQQIDLIPKKCGFLCKIFTPQPATCSDGVKNQDETDVDCGGSCPVCEQSLPPIDENGDEIIEGNFGCEGLEIEELFISPGNVGNEVLNNRYIDFTDDEELIIDELFSTQLEEGREYFIPIPNQECYWHATYENEELYIITECYADEEIA
ncbi:MAG: hypothetical protein Q8O84_00515 [Nanoarchaeota archaeon]|nr:hypothetical protein [Nanoarchaeota archaeon]